MAGKSVLNDAVAIILFPPHLPLHTHTRPPLTRMAGESVLNDAVAIVLFHTFRKYYEDRQQVTKNLTH